LGGLDLTGDLWENRPAKQEPKVTAVASFSENTDLATAVASSSLSKSVHPVMFHRRILTSSNDAIVFHAHFIFCLNTYCWHYATL